MLDKLEDDQFVHWWSINPYYPFTDQGEWELGKFLVENLNQTQIMKFLKLKWFDASNRGRPSFTMKDHLLDWMDSLPSFTACKVSKLEFKGYKTVHPMELVIQQLFSDPMFANHMTFNPYIANVKNHREYGDYMSANMAWKIQDYLPLGATQVPIILGSDKTPVTRLAGGIEMHPVFVTISNIDSEVHSKATLQAWCCVAYIPIVKFHIHQEYQSILQARLWHKCIDLVFANLKVTANNGCFMPDPSRYIRHVFTPLVAHSQKVAKVINLSGVHMPYWHDWKFACPSVFLAGKVLHTCHKFFTDHPLKWIKEALGDYELNTDFMVQHKQVGMCHFTKGITHINQMTGWEHRDIQCTIVASIAGAIPHRFICAICALVDFFYLTQNPSLVQALLDFHSFKDAIIQAKARKGKKGLFQSFHGTIKKLENLMQFSADVTEWLLITHCKNLFPWTSQKIKDFTEQCVCILNRQESMEIFDLASLVNAIHAEDEDVTIANPALSWVSRVLLHEVKSIHGDALTAFQLNVMPDYKLLSVFDMRTKYALLTLTFRSNPKSVHFHVWHKFRLQLHSAFQPRVIMPSQVVQAYPPTNGFPFGNCNAVLIDATGIDGKMMNYVAQVHLIFQPTVQQGSNLELPSYLSDPLLYVQVFRFIHNPDDHPELAMWTVERTYTQDGNGNRCREGAVVRVTDVTHVVELIPVYGEAMANGMSSATCLESYDRFFLNSFADKESYHISSTEFV
ncbi:uncharacterized protein EDB93DRAFT_1241855 [Suillus bovinus]|uniref:uncharacterized protein n=1 Tax=Suillus bovinus TaxID=48563 RepID=UPI001B885790|nr:uncharacterized protein EDB93DRAFT_1241855 [Suillus bovinus]KAG2140491.1 hypothetical protein EDB93DRAFT_1241855 [Suillus bovinus]